MKERYFFTAITNTTWLFIQKNINLFYKEDLKKFQQRLLTYLNFNYGYYKM